MKVRFWGVRGSVPVPGASTVRYGGNTACVEVTGGAGECVILDAGTGLRPLGMDMLGRCPLPSPIHLLITHTHWDHIEGFPFFAPCYLREAEVRVFGPAHFRSDRSLRAIFEAQMQYEFFPVSNQQLAASISYESLAETSFSIGTLRVATQFMNHSVQCLGYRISGRSATLVYTGDHEPYYNLFCDEPEHDMPEDGILPGSADAMVASATERFLSFLDRADLVIIDAQYTPQEYPSKKRTWGHSSWDFCLDWMQRAAVRRMVLTHHDPLRTDDTLDAAAIEISRAAAARGIDPEAVSLAREGMEIEL